MSRFSELLQRVIPPYTGGSGDTVFGIDIYDSPHYGKPWFQPIRKYHHFLKQIDNIWFWFHYRFVSRFHIVKTDLKPGYQDVDEIMFRACFALLGRFVEEELTKAAEDEEWQYRGYRVDHLNGTDEEAIDLWLWYRDQFPLDCEEYASLPSKQIEDLKDHKLRQLIDIRKSLWT